MEKMITSQRFASTLSAKTPAIDWPVVVPADYSHIVPSFNLNEGTASKG